MYFGENGDDPKNVTISLVRSSRGSTRVRAAENVVGTAVVALKPKAVFSVGCCAGLQKEQAQLGDVVISGKRSPRGDKTIVNNKPQLDGLDWMYPRIFGVLLNPQQLHGNHHCRT